MTTTAPTTASRPDPVGTSRQGLGPLVALHALFLAGGAVALALDPPAQGWGVLACVAAYAVGLPLVCRATGRDDLGALAVFLLLVSVWQVLPDWVLVDLVGTLRFPDTGGLRVDDAIPLAMAGMWLAPLFVALALSGGRPGRAAVLAAAVFAGAELLAPVLDLWEPVGDTARVLGVAVYVVPAEAALGWAAATAFALVRGRALPVQAGAALAVSTLYLGALVLAHFLVDVAGWRLTV
ncbi:DUF6989 domain-containing protein [Nocardioides perillae]|uniref:DUF6989 domain-containing protein n=1 Tax=Nocardioides perillae TaxID=1119534 RepID=A0A7Y9UUV6_9ACTN|nr:hypothetical protein [Nocardioides perillae]NYG53940.1 hypothetical protein [Nocardioides perillae]